MTPGLQAAPAGPRHTRGIWLLTLALAGVFLFLAFRGAQWSRILELLSSARPGWIALAIAEAGLLYAVRAARWNVVLGSRRRIRWIRVFWATVVGYLGNNYLPAKAGEVMRSVLLGRSEGLSQAFVFATVLTERAMDTCTVLLIAAVVSFIAPIGAMHGAGPAAAAALAVLCIFVLPRMPRWLHGLAARVPVPEKWRDRLRLLIEHFLEGLNSLREGRRMTAFCELTAVIWMLDAGILLTVGWAMSIPITPALSLLLVTVLAAAAALPSTPGYIGVQQFAAVTVLEPFGISRNESLAFILMSQAVRYTVVTVLGLVGLWRLRSPAGGPATSCAPTPSGPMLPRQRET